MRCRRAVRGFEESHAHPDPESNVDESADHDGHVFYREYDPGTPPGDVKKLRFLAVMHKADPYDWALTFRDGSDPIARGNELDGSFERPPVNANNMTMQPNSVTVATNSTSNYTIPHGQQYTFGVTGREAVGSVHVDIDITTRDK